MASSDKPSFDVYGMLLVLGFVLTLGSTLLLNDSLTSDWGFKLGGDAPAQQSWHLTQYRDLTKTYSANAPYVDVRKKDLDEWKKAHNRTGKENGDNFPVKNFEWPAGYKVNEFPVDPLKANNWEEAQPNPNDSAEVAKTKAATLEQYNLLLNSATVVPETPKETPAAPEKPATPETPATPEKPAEKPAEKAATPETTEKTPEKAATPETK